MTRSDAAPETRPYRGICIACENEHGIVPETEMCGGCTFGEADAMREYDEDVGL